MSTERQQLEATIAGLLAQRVLLGDAMVDVAVVALRAKLASLEPAPPDDAPVQILKQATILFLDIGQPYGLLRDLLAQRLEIADTDSTETARRKIEQGVGSLFEPDYGAAMAQANAHVLGHLIVVEFSASRYIAGIKDDAKQIRSRGFHAAAQMFRRMSAKDGIPVVLLLDDLHWADDGSLDFLAFLAQADRDVPMLVLGLTRPALFGRADWNDGESALRVDLGPLDRDVSRLLVNELLKKLDDVPSTLRELITGGAEGNPFYMEELVKMLVDEGAIKAGGERWSVVPERLVATHVPQTLTGVLQARLDGLDPVEKLALQQASIVGFVFWDQALAAIDAAAPEALPGLVRRELVIPRRDTAPWLTSTACSRTSPPAARWRPPSRLTSSACRAIGC